MAQYNIDDPEYKIVCPYDDTHKISRKIMQTHLRKCRKNFKNIELVKCPFNATHEFEAHKLQTHISTCRDRARIEQDIKYDQKKGSSEDYLKSDTYESLRGWAGPEESTEDWGADVDSESFVWSVNAEKDSGKSPSGLPELSTVPKVLTKSHRQFPDKDAPEPVKPRPVNAVANPSWDLSLNNSHSSASVGRGIGRGVPQASQGVHVKKRAVNAEFFPGYGRGQGRWNR